jgi:hypothetical protein
VHGGHDRADPARIERGAGARTSTRSYTLTCLPSSIANTRPSVVRRTRGAGTPAAQAASWNAAAERTSSSPDRCKGTVTAQLPPAVSSRHTSPCLPRATGPSDSLAARPRPRVNDERGLGT